MHSGQHDIIYLTFNIFSEADHFADVRKKV